MECPIYNCAKEMIPKEVEVEGKKAFGQKHGEIYIHRMYVCPDHNYNGAAEVVGLKSEVKK